MDIGLVLSCKIHSYIISGIGVVLFQFRMTYLNTIAKDLTTITEILWQKN